MDAIARLTLARYAAFGVVQIAAYVWALRVTEILTIGTGRTLLVLLALFVCLGLLGRLLHRPDLRGGWKPPLFVGWHRVSALVPLMLTFAALALAFYLFSFSIALGALGLAPGFSEQQAPRLGMVLGCIALVVVVLALVPLTMARRLAMRRLRTASHADTRAPVLMLRSFADDNRQLRARRSDRASVIDRLCLRRWDRFEEVVASHLGHYGPVVALSQVGERLPPALGAVRRSFSMDDWKDNVGTLIREATLVCVTVGRSESLRWEIRQIRAAGALSRTIFVLPPTSSREQRMRLRFLSHVLGTEPASLDLTAPGVDVLAVVTCVHGHYATITSGAADDVSYEAALDAAAAWLTREAEHAQPAPGRDLIGSKVRKSAQLEIFAPGASPPYKPLLKRPLFVAWVFLTLISAIVIPFIGLEKEGLSATVKLPGIPSAIIQDDVSDRLYVVVNHHSIYAIDLARRTSAPVFVIKQPVNDLVVHDGVAFFTSASAATVGAIDLRSKQVKWKVASLAGARGAAIVGSNLVVAVTAQNRVYALSLANGAQNAVAQLPGRPWAVAADGKDVLVTLQRTSEVASLRGSDLSRGVRVKTVQGPSDIAISRDSVWVLGSLAHVLQSTDVRDASSQKRLFLESQSAVVASSGTIVAVGERGRIVIIGPSLEVKRVLVPFDTVSSILLTKTGTLIVGSADSPEVVFGPA